MNAQQALSQVRSAPEKDRWAVTDVLRSEVEMAQMGAYEMLVRQD